MKDFSSTVHSTKQPNGAASSLALAPIAAAATAAAILLDRSCSSARFLALPSGRRREWLDAEVTRPQQTSHTKSSPLQILYFESKLVQQIGS